MGSYKLREMQLVLVLVALRSFKCGHVFCLVALFPRRNFAAMAPEQGTKVGTVARETS